VLNLKFRGLLSRLAVKEAIALKFVSSGIDPRAQVVEVRADVVDFSGHVASRNSVKHAEQMQQNDHPERTG
jgi:hypothetical protein